MLDWIKADGAELVKEINDTTKEALRVTLAEGIEQCESIPKLRDCISAVFTDVKEK